MFLGYASNGLGTYFNLLVETGPWRVVEYTNGWCLRGIYNYGGLWEHDLHVSAPSSSEVIIMLNRTEKST